VTRSHNPRKSIRPGATARAVSPSEPAITLQPLKLERNCTYVIEYPGVFTQPQMEQIRESLQVQAKGLGVRFLILEGGMHVAREDAYRAIISLHDTILQMKKDGRL
jgi:hypothetical protein